MRRAEVAAGEAAVGARRVVPKRPARQVARPPHHHKLAGDHFLQVAVERAVQLLVFVGVEAVGGEVDPPDLLRSYHAAKVVLHTQLDAGTRLMSIDGVVQLCIMKPRVEALHRCLKALIAVHDHVRPQGQDCVEEYRSFRIRDEADHLSVRALEK